MNKYKKLIIGSLLLFILNGCGNNKLDMELVEKTTEEHKTEEIENTTEGISTDDMLKDTEENQAYIENNDDSTEQQITDITEDISNEYYGYGSYEPDWGGADTAEEALDLFWKSVKDEDVELAKKISWGYYIRFAGTGREMLATPTWYNYLNICHSWCDGRHALKDHIVAYKEISETPEANLQEIEIIEQSKIQEMQKNILSDLGSNVYIQAAYVYVYNLRDIYNGGEQKTAVMIIKADNMWYVITKNYRDIKHFTGSSFYEYDNISPDASMDGEYKCIRAELDGQVYTGDSLSSLPIIYVDGSDCEIGKKLFKISLVGNSVLFESYNDNEKASATYDKDNETITIYEETTYIYKKNND